MRLNLTPAPEDVLVRLKNNFGCDELNVAGRSYRPDQHGAFWVERRHVTPELRNIGGFVEEPYPTKAESLRAVATAIAQMKPCDERAKLSAALADLFETVDGE
jgi:hypothetical protein